MSLNNPAAIGYSASFVVYAASNMAPYRPVRNSTSYACAMGCVRCHGALGCGPGISQPGPAEQPVYSHHHRASSEHVGTGNRENREQSGRHFLGHR